MKLKWLDTREVAISLEEQYPDIDNLNLSFPNLHKLVLSLKEFDDDPKTSNEKILEAIQMTWIEERDDG
jgi:FeS assembly protein IscX